MAFVAAASAYYNNSSKKSSGESRSQTDREGSAGTSLAGTNITRRFDDKSKVILDSFLRQQSDAVQREGEFTREAAIRDSRDIIQQIFNEYKTQALPEIFNAQGSVGAYNSTGAQSLANQAFAESVAKSASVVSDQIAKYAQINQGEQQLALSSLLQAFGLEAQAFASETIDQRSSSDFLSKALTTGSQTGRSTQVDYGGKVSYGG